MENRNVGIGEDRDRLKVLPILLGQARDGCQPATLAREPCYSAAAAPSVPAVKTWWVMHRPRRELVDAGAMGSCEVTFATPSAAAYGDAASFVGTPRTCVRHS